MASKKYQKVNVRIYIVTWIREGSTKTIELSVLYALTSRVFFIHYAAFVVTFSCKKICWPLFRYLIEITFLEDHQPMCVRSVNSTMYRDLKCYHKSRLQLSLWIKKIKLNLKNYIWTIFYAVSSVVSDLFTFSGVTRSPVPILCKENWKLVPRQKGAKPHPG